MLVEGVHFRLATTGRADLGARAVAVNLSDLAAMGVEPGGGDRRDWACRADSRPTG